ncbi:hypothetical protein BDZ91DRAFT_720565 [Kalaharituber pfeilii]|nr:hypothetical protein BDZ91DRAFT_720565 [Kalaharituber pfeilii]
MAAQPACVWMPGAGSAAMLVPVAQGRCAARHANQTVETLHMKSRGVAYTALEIAYAFQRFGMLLYCFCIAPGLGPVSIVLRLCFHGPRSDHRTIRMEGVAGCAAHAHSLTLPPLQKQLIFPLPFCRTVELSCPPDAPPYCALVNASIGSPCAFDQLAMPRPAQLSQVSLLGNP